MLFVTGKMQNNSIFFIPLGVKQKKNSLSSTTESHAELEKQHIGLHRQKKYVFIRLTVILYGATVQSSSPAVHQGSIHDPVINRVL